MTDDLQTQSSYPHKNNTEPVKESSELLGVFNDQLVRKHPHGRGEDLTWIYGFLAVLETPPRAWGRSTRKRSARSGRGNTPTGVGKMISRYQFGDTAQKH